jgi:hypothetical protein
MGSSTGVGADLITTDVHAVVTGSLTAVPTDTVGSILSIDENGTNTSLDADSSGFLDANDSLTAFSLSANTNLSIHEDDAVKHSFYVASNTAFDIKAVANTSTTEGDIGSLGLAGIGYSLKVTQSGNDGLAFGSSAQFPHTGASTTSGITAGIDDLGDISSEAYVFNGDQRTASANGGIASQSVRFDATYSLQDSAGNPYDLSMGTGLLAADVTYTIWSP